MRVFAIILRMIDSNKTKSVLKNISLTQDVVDKGKFITKYHGDINFSSLIRMLILKEFREISLEIETKKQKQGECS